MEERKNLCVQIPLSLHARARQEQEACDKTLSEYITEVLTEYYEGGSNLTGSSDGIIISKFMGKQT